VCAENGLDCLSNSQWKTIENVVDLLRPFKDLTNSLQSDCSSLSAVIPAILDLQAHLKQSPEKALHVFFFSPLLIDSTFTWIRRMSILTPLQL
jgi:hypothetical protein